MFKDLKHGYIIYIAIGFICYKIFMCTIDWNKPRTDCKRFVEINSISSEDKPYKVKSKTCYKINIGGSYTMNFKFISHGGKGVYIDADNFPKGTSTILIQYFENSKFLRELGSKLRQVGCSPIEATFRYFNDIRKNDVCYFSITSWADPNNTYGYDLYFEELDEIPE